MNRRRFVQASSAALTAAAAAVIPIAAAGGIPIIDAHIHLFDPTRPQGGPWPPTNSEIYKPALPERFRRLTGSFGVRGVIEIECSPWLEDNQWVLDVAAKDRLILGTVGNLEPASPEFPKQFERFHRNPLFRGIRYGNPWDRSLSAQLAKPVFVEGLKLVAQAGLVTDTANPNPALIETIVRVTDKVPDLRMVIDHLPQCNPPAEPAPRAEYDRNLRRLAAQPQVYVKISQVLRRVGGQGRVAAEKYFWKNSQAAYRWAER